MNPGYLLLKSTNENVFQRALKLLIVIIVNLCFVHRMIPYPPNGKKQTKLLNTSIQIKIVEQWKH